MVLQESILVLLLALVDRMPQPNQLPEKAKRGKGRPAFYTDRLFLKALVIMIVRRLHHIYELLNVLEQPTVEMQRLRACLVQSGRYPCRRTFERRLATLPETLPAQIGCLGRHLVCLIQPWAHCGRAAAMDSTVLRAKDGAVWHNKDRQAGVVPHSRIDTEAGWTKSGWHGWVYGWKLHLASVVAEVWLPLAAKLTVANTDDGEIGYELLPEIPGEVHYVLGDQHYHRDLLEQACHQRGIELVTSQPGKYPHNDIGVEVRRVFHKLRSLAMENLNEHLKAIFEVHGAVPTKGAMATTRFALGAVLVYQLSVCHRFEQGMDMNEGLNHFLRAA